jgi:hypothetical protein
MGKRKNTQRDTLSLQKVHCWKIKKISNSGPYVFKGQDKIHNNNNIEKLKIHLFL